MEKSSTFLSDNAEKAKGLCRITKVSNDHRRRIDLSNQVPILAFL